MSLCSSAYRDFVLLLIRENQQNINKSRVFLYFKKCLQNIKCHLSSSSPCSCALNSVCHDDSPILRGLYKQLNPLYLVASFCLWSLLLWISSTTVLPPRNGESTLCRGDQSEQCSAASYARSSLWDPQSFGCGCAILNVIQQPTSKGFELSKTYCTSHYVFVDFCLCVVFICVLQIFLLLRSSFIKFINGKNNI